MNLQLEQLKHFSSEKGFHKGLLAFLKPFFLKGIPSLFGKLKSLYPSKASWVESLLLQIHASLSAQGTFPGEHDVQTPSALLWADMVLGQHYDHTREIPKARDHLDAAIAHTPTLIDLYLARARVEKHAGCPQEASALLSQGMRLDTADRYLNNKAIKYLLRANKVEEAQSLFKEFMKEDSNAHDLQTMWYEIETAQAYLRLGQTAPALRWFHFIHTHYDEIFED